MGLILDLSPRVLERVLYFSMYIVTNPGNVRELSKMQTLTEKGIPGFEGEVRGRFRGGHGRRGH